MASAPGYAKPLVMVVAAAASLIPTFAGWYWARNAAEQEAKLRFEARAEEISSAVRDRMLDYEQVMRGAVGLFAASEQVTWSEWSTYVRSIQIERAYPGIQGLGFAPYVGAEGKAELERAARPDGNSTYRVFPAGTRQAYVPVQYLLPLDERNRRALGYDMYSEQIRRRAIDRARDTGEPAISGIVTLVQESGADSQPGFLMYVPVYNHGAPTATVAERRQALVGFVYSSFRAGDLMTALIGRNPGVEIRVADATPPEPVTEFFRGTARGAAPGSARSAWFARSDSIPLRGRLWQLDTATLPSFEAEIKSNRPEIILAGGLAISALLLLIVWTLLTTRERAREIARHMTVALRASEERLQTALASSRLALFDWDVSAGLVQLSSEWSAMLGGRPGPTLVPMQKLQEMMHPDDAAMVQSQVQDLLSGQIDSYSVEHRVQRLDGSWKWIASRAKVNERDAAGRALRVTGANADIDERKALDYLKSEFIATVNHELRTPLTNILASLALLREGKMGALPPDAVPFADIAYDNTKRLAALVNDILDIERIEAGRLELRIEPLALDELLRRAISLSTPYAEQFGVRLVLNNGTPVARVRADSERLIQVMRNLLSNAAKYAPRGSDVAVTVADSGASVRILVSDRGPGIPPEFESRLFGKFEQADRKHGGTGLGLAISKALVEKMGGHIGYQGQSAQGNTFWVELPVA